MRPAEEAARVERLLQSIAPAAIAAFARTGEFTYSIRNTDSPVAPTQARHRDGSPLTGDEVALLATVTWEDVRSALASLGTFAPTGGDR